MMAPATREDEEEVSVAESVTERLQISQSQEVASQETLVVERLGQDTQYTQESDELEAEPAPPIPAQVPAQVPAAQMPPQQMQQMSFAQQQAQIQHSWATFQPPNPINWMQALRTADAAAAQQCPSVHPQVVYETHPPPALPPARAPRGGRGGRRGGRGGRGGRGSRGGGGAGRRSTSSRSQSPAVEGMDYEEQEYQLDPKAYDQFKDEEEEIFLAQLCLDRLPIGSVQWEKITSVFNTRYPTRQRAQVNLRRKFAQPVVKQAGPNR